MEEREALDIMRRTGVIVSDGHFVLASGEHTDVYLNKDAAYVDTDEIALLCRAISWKFKDAEADVVIASATAGIVLTQWTAHYLSRISGRKVIALYAEKVPGSKSKALVLKRGYDKLIRGKRVVVLDDIITTGESLGKVAALVRRHGGVVCGAGVIWNRGGVAVESIEGLPVLHALINLRVPSWPAADCSLCRDGFPVSIEFGRGSEPAHS